MHVCMPGCLYVYMYVCMHLCMGAWIYVQLFKKTGISTEIKTDIFKFLRTDNEIRVAGTDRRLTGQGDILYKYFFWCSLIYSPWG